MVLTLLPSFPRPRAAAAATAASCASCAAAAAAAALSDAFLFRCPPRLGMSAVRVRALPPP